MSEVLPPGIKEIKGTLSKEQHWHFRYAMQTMRLAKIESELASKEYAFQSAQIEIARLKLQIFKGVVDSRKKKSDDSLKEYHELRDSISEEFGHSLDDCIIDDLGRVMVSE